MNVRMTVAYVGTRYAGWQLQDNALAVQQVVEAALSDLAGEPVRVAGAGRTDAGVHASGQVVSFRLGREWPAAALVQGGNHRLPPDVRFLDAEAVAGDFHARRSAGAKVYRYRVHLGRVVPPDRAPFALGEAADLDVAALAAAARHLPGEHDFAPFALAGGAPGPTRRRIFAAAWERDGPEIVFRIAGEGFLRGMVRRLVGTQLEIARARRAPESLAQLLDGTARGPAGATAPAHGLALERVDYPPESAGALR